MSEQNKQKVDYPITFGAVYPGNMSRLTTFFRFLLIIPHIIVLYFLTMAGAVVAFIAWWAIMFTGNYPKGLFDFFTGYMRWSTRVTGYMYFLTDKHPPYTMD